MRVNASLNNLVEIQRNLLNFIIKDDNKLNFFNPPKKTYSNDVINFMLVNNGNYNLVLQTHILLVRKLVHKTFLHNYRHEDLRDYLSMFDDNPIDKLQLDVRMDSVIDNLTNQDICDLLEAFHNFYLNSEFRLRNQNLI
jgi:hypothetical protein